MKNTTLAKEISFFAWIAIATVILLLIPLSAMQFTDEVNWGEEDFIIMFLLVFGMSSLFVLISRRLSTKKRRIGLGILFIGALLFLWAELAVGVFTKLGN